jgi:hypothetical protein
MGEFSLIAQKYFVPPTSLCKCCATALFILSVKWMSSPATARRGVWAGEFGMLLAVAGTLLHRGIVDYEWLAAALVLGTIIGVPLGKVAMTAVPQRTALSHAFGALCVTLVGTAEFYLHRRNCRNNPGLASRARLSLPADRYSAADLWPAHDHPHRRRGHAHRNFSLEFLRRICQLPPWASCSITSC